MVEKFTNEATLTDDALQFAPNKIEKKSFY